ncbi:MAG: hypothetical protein LBV72_01880, partial [Tannerella sp.]|nr:hypothetical protein [Tannerella sp.]
MQSSTTLTNNNRIEIADVLRGCLFQPKSIPVFQSKSIPLYLISKGIFRVVDAGARIFFLP